MNLLYRLLLPCSFLLLICTTSYSKQKSVEDLIIDKIKHYSYAGVCVVKETGSGNELKWYKYKERENFWGDYKVYEKFFYEHKKMFETLNISSSYWVFRVSKNGQKENMPIMQIIPRTEKGLWLGYLRIDKDIVIPSDQFDNIMRRYAKSRIIKNQNNDN